LPQEKELVLRLKFPRVTTAGLFSIAQKAKYFRIIRIPVNASGCCELGVIEIPIIMKNYGRLTVSVRNITIP
jgi:hypothetical protein